MQQKGAECVRGSGVALRAQCCGRLVRRLICARLAGYAALAVLFCLQAESVPIFAAMPRGHHGLNLTTAQIAGPYCVGGACLIVSALVLYPAAHAKFGNRGCVTLGLAVMLAALLTLPTLSLLPASRPGLTLAALAALQAMSQLAVNFAFSTGNAMVNEVAMGPDLRDQLGAINGAGQTLSALARGAGPCLAGAAWSLIAAAGAPPWGPFVPFWLLAGLAGVVLRMYAVA